MIYQHLQQWKMSQDLIYATTEHLFFLHVYYIGDLYLMEVVLRAVWKEARKNLFQSQPIFVRHLDTVPAISYVRKTTLVLFDVERHTGVLVFFWWFNSRAHHICFAVSPLQFCRWECHTILHDIGPKTTWSASGEVHEGPMQISVCRGGISVTFPLLFQNHYPFKVPSLGWLREIVALLFWQSEITVKCHKVDTLSAFQNFGHNAQLPTLFM